MKAAVKSKGVNKVTKRLANGERRVYLYHRETGIKLPDDAKSKEFFEAYNAAEKSMEPKREYGSTALLRKIETLGDLTDQYLDSAKFRGTAERTKSDYRKIILIIKRQFGDLPIQALEDRRCRHDFLNWQNELAKKSLRQADYVFAVFKLVLQWSLDHDLIKFHPLEKVDKLYKSDRIDKIWTRDDESRFLAIAADNLKLPFLLAIWTGQRQGDLLALPWSAYDGNRITLRQSKTGARVAVPVAGMLKAKLDATPKTGIQILQNSRGVPWTSNGFSVSWRKCCKKAGVVGLTFHDLRGTAVTRLALSGATETEIATVTGLSLKGVGSILESHYLSRDPALAESAILKLNRTFGEQSLQTALQTVQTTTN